MPFETVNLTQWLSIHTGKQQRFISTVRINHHPKHRTSHHPSRALGDTGLEEDRCAQAWCDRRTLSMTCFDFRADFGVVLKYCFGGLYATRLAQNNTVAAAASAHPSFLTQVLLYCSTSALTHTSSESRTTSRSSKTSLMSRLRFIPPNWTVRRHNHTLESCTLIS